MDDDTVVQAIRGGQGGQLRSTTTGQQALTASGVSSQVLAAMKTRAARTHPASTHTAATHAPSADGVRNEKLRVRSDRVGWQCWPLRRLSAPARGQDDDAARARILWFRRWSELLRKAENEAFEDALQLLKHAVQECSELGDAWYYRSLVEQRLGHDALAKYAMDKARFNGSEALEQGLNPLVLATPAGRGFTRKRARRERRSAAAARRVVARSGCAKVGAGCGHRPIYRQQHSAPELHDRGRKFVCRRADRSGHRAISGEPRPRAHR